MNDVTDIRNYTHSLRLEHIARLCVGTEYLKIVQKDGNGIQIKAKAPFGPSYLFYLINSLIMEANEKGSSSTDYLLFDDAELVTKVQLLSNINKSTAQKDFDI